ncbi:MAG: transporter related protein [Frankiales bacterium]|nr:transporter related protein [Frankiales bacterium]
MSQEPLLRLTGIVKRYPGVTALKSVTFDVLPGEVHAIVGENGAGKSTLMGVACGAVTPDHGQVEIGGELLRRPSPALAQQLGIAVVYQHASVLDDLTVAENILYAVPKDRRPSRASATEWVQQHLDAVGATVGAGLRVGELTVAQRQLVELARALAVDAKVLILDEPTESLTAAETERLFTQIERMRAAGSGVVYISHRFGEVRKVADRITVLRDGESRGTMRAADVTEEDVVALIVGRRVDHVFPERREKSGPGAALLTASNLSGPGFADVTATIHAGEIVGLAGIEGNGQREFLRALGGLASHSGQLALEDGRGSYSSPGSAISSGVVYLPADRHREGAFLPMSVATNASALRHGALSGLGFLRGRRENALAREAVSSLRIRTPRIGTPVSSLSGGNQQKVVIARSLAAEPRVLLADEPTRGVDVGSRSEIYRTLRNFADAGNGVAVVSSDAIELAGLCDRVLVFSRGHVIRELRGDELSERGITGASIGSTMLRAETPRTGGRASTLRGIPTLLRGEHLPSAIVAALIVVLGVYTTARSSLFLGERSMSNLMLLGAITAFAALGELTALLLGSIDLSVGPLIGLTVVILSFFAGEGSGMGGLVVGIVVAALVGVAVGSLNMIMIRLVRLPAVVATLVTYILLQGISLFLRPQPAGYLDSSVTSAIQSGFGSVPGVLVLAVLVAVLAQFALHRTRAGVELRAVGSDEVRARQLGVPVGRTFLRGHVLCSLGAVVAGVVLASVAGVGDASLGTNYTLTAVAAVVLGGASIFGGRGSYAGALLAALLLQEITSATTFLHLPEAWQEWLPGLLILLGAAAFSRRGARTATVAG